MERKFASFSMTVRGAFSQAENSMRDILSPVKRPQVNGKIERWNDTYEKNRFRFDNFYDFMNWYNTVRFHESLDTKWYLQTPDIAFCARLLEECKLGMFLNRMETELNVEREIYTSGRSI
jgi:transposase InsO family protein